MSERDDLDDEELELDPADDNVDTDPPEMDDDEGGEEDEDDLDIGFDGETAEEGDAASRTIKLLRSQNEVLRAAAKAQPAPAPVDPGPRPTLEGAGYDEDKLADDMAVWAAKKSAFDNAASTTEQAGAIDWPAQGLKYASTRDALKRPDFKVSEDVVSSKLNKDQLAIVLLADDPGKMIYALGRAPAKLDELASHKNLALFAMNVARLEGKITMKTKKTAPEPDKPVSGSARMSKGADKREQELEKKADKTGDRSELAAYRREKKLARR